MITYEQALETARAYDPSYDHVIDYEHAYEFCWEAPKREMGPHPVFVAKESGELLTMMDGIGGGFARGKRQGEWTVSAGPQPRVTPARGLRDVMYGAAVGDALGVPYEFRGAGAFTCTGMASGGAHNQPTGTFSDDTSMLLATCDSIRETGRIDVDDMRKRFNDWVLHGEYAVNHVVFDVGGTVSAALTLGVGRDDVRSNGNGSLMRIAPLAFTDASDDDVRAVSAITHAHRISTESCVCFVGLLRGLLAGESWKKALERNIPAGEEFAFLHDVASRPVSEVRGTGFVLDTLGAFVWCLANTDSYAECVRAAVNLGDDTDTTACVAGALAGAVYGYDAIPAEWLAVLRGKDIIDACLFA